MTDIINSNELGHLSSMANSITDGIPGYDFPLEDERIFISRDWEPFAIVDPDGFNKYFTEKGIEIPLGDEIKSEDLSLLLSLGIITDKIQSIGEDIYFDDSES